MQINEPSGSIITLEYGSGGQKTIEFINSHILAKLKNPYLEPLDDSAELPIPQGGRLAFTTDSYVVDPIFFPGGDIGCLSVYGTVNDLCMQGAQPLYIGLSLIIEEGLMFEELIKILESVREASQRAKVTIVTGDTKVVKRGEADRLYITTSGIGVIPEAYDFCVRNAKVGDLVIINGTIGDHGVAILSAREELGIRSNITSDTAPLSLLLEHLGDLRRHIHVMKDPTRGGLATTLNEIASASSASIQVWEEAIPIKEEVRKITELLGLDPLYLANEGKCVAVVERSKAEEILDRMRTHTLGEDSQIIGEIIEGVQRRVLVKTRIGGTRILQIPRGIQLPRIC